jgi:hypothetical protein
MVINLCGCYDELCSYHNLDYTGNYVIKGINSNDFAHNYVRRYDMEKEGRGRTWYIKNVGLVSEVGR